MTKSNLNPSHISSRSKRKSPPKFISYEKLSLNIEDEVYANLRFIEKCSRYGIGNGIENRHDWFFVLNEFVKEKLVLVNTESGEYELIDSRFDSKEYFLLALESSQKKEIKNAVKFEAYYGTLKIS
jgi:hypothetical protein